MGKLYSYLFLLLLLFSAAIGLIAAGVFGSDWIVLVIGFVVLVVTAAAGGGMPRVRKSLPQDETKAANWLLQAFGAFCALEVLVMGLVLWAWGNRDHTLQANNWYQVLGLLIFLALVGLGIQGALATIVLFVQARHKVLVNRAAVLGHEAHGPEHGGLVAEHA